MSGSGKMNWLITHVFIVHISLKIGVHMGFSEILCHLFDKIDFIIQFIVVRKCPLHVAAHESGIQSSASK